MQTLFLMDCNGRNKGSLSPTFCFPSLIPFPLFASTHSSLFLPRTHAPMSSPKEESLKDKVLEESLKDKVRRLEQEKEALEQQINALRAEKRKACPSEAAAEHNPEDPPEPMQKRAKLTNPEIARYGRQLILPGFGIQGMFL